MRKFDEARIKCWQRSTSSSSSWIPIAKEFDESGQLYNSLEYNASVKFANWFRPVLLILGQIYILRIYRMDLITTAHGRMLTWNKISIKATIKVKKKKLNNKTVIFLCTVDTFIYISFYYEKTWCIITTNGTFSFDSSAFNLSLPSPTETAYIFFLRLNLNL